MPCCQHAPSDLGWGFKASDYLTGDTFEVRRCAQCGFGATLPRPEDLAAYYPQEYYGVVGSPRFPAVVEAAQRVLYSARARRIEKLAGGRPGRVLDIGCGPGALLAAFRRRGWEVHGTELSDESAKRGRSAGIPICVGPFESWPWPAGHFDAVVMWHVLEHWRDPAPVVRRVHDLLRDGGIFMVGVPNFGSLEARLARDNWFHLDVPRHLIHFTPRSLADLLESRGFSIHARAFHVPEYDSFSFVQSALNQFGLGRNVLYNLLRGRSAKLLQGGGGLRAVASTVLAAPLGLLSVPITLLAGVAGQGSSMTMHAVKGAAKT